MKPIAKWLVIVLSITVLSFLSACGSGSGESKPSEEEKPTETPKTPEPKPENPGEGEGEKKGEDQGKGEKKEDPTQRGACAQWILGPADEPIPEVRTIDDPCFQGKIAEADGWEMPVGFEPSSSGFQFLEDTGRGTYKNCGAITIFHPAADINHEKGGNYEKDNALPFHAVADGVVVALSRKGWTPLAVMHLWRGKIYYSVYGHGDIDPELKVGSVVKRGRVLGTIGNNGLGGGYAHVHFEIRRELHPAHRPVKRKVKGEELWVWQHLPGGYFCHNTSKEIVGERYEDPLRFIRTNSRLQKVAFRGDAFGLAWSPSDTACGVYRANEQHFVIYRNKHGYPNLYRLASGGKNCELWGTPWSCSLDNAPDRTETQTDHLPVSIRQLAKGRIKGSDYPNSYLVLVKEGDIDEIQIISAYEEKGVRYALWSNVKELLSTDIEARYQWLGFEYSVLETLRMMEKQGKLQEGNLALTVAYTAVLVPYQPTAYTCREWGGSNKPLDPKTSPYWQGPCRECIKLAVASEKLYKEVKAIMNKDDNNTDQPSGDGDNGSGRRYGETRP